MTTCERHVSSDSCQSPKRLRTALPLYASTTQPQHVVFLFLSLVLVLRWSITDVVHRRAYYQPMWIYFYFDTDNLVRHRYIYTRVRGISVAAGNGQPTLTKVWCDYRDGTNAFPGRIMSGQNGSGDPVFEMEIPSTISLVPTATNRATTNDHRNGDRLGMLGAMPLPVAPGHPR